MMSVYNETHESRALQEVQEGPEIKHKVFVPARVCSLEEILSGFLEQKSCCRLCFVP